MGEIVKKMDREMKKRLYGFRIDLLRKALKCLGYKGATLHMGYPTMFDYWIKDNYHLSLREQRNHIELRIERYPEFNIGKPRTRGEDLEEEVRLLIKKYKEIRYEGEG